LPAIGGSEAPLLLVSIHRPKPAPTTSVHRSKTTLISAAHGAKSLARTIRRRSKSPLLTLIHRTKSTSPLRTIHRAESAALSPTPRPKFAASAVVRLLPISKRRPAILLTESVRPPLRADSTPTAPTWPIALAAPKARRLLTRTILTIIPPRRVLLLSLRISVDLRPTPSLLSVAAIIVAALIKFLLHLIELGRQLCNLSLKSGNRLRIDSSIFILSPVRLCPVRPILYATPTWPKLPSIRTAISPLSWSKVSPIHRPKPAASRPRPPLRPPIRATARPEPHSTPWSPILSTILAPGISVPGILIPVILISRAVVTRRAALCRRRRGWGRIRIGTRG
jgi:hypothetical protein